MASESVERLNRCFVAVFPGIGQNEIETASTDNTQERDSIATVMLFSLISQEFGIKILPQQMFELKSYSAIHAFLTEQGKMI